MTSEKAIKVLTLHKENWERLLREHIAEQQEGNEMVEALQMAIEALKNERPQGKWIDKDVFGEEVYCSECNHMEKKEKFIWSDVNYCYFCGARMEANNE